MDYSLALASLQATDPRLASVIQQVGDCQLAQNNSNGDLLATLAESILYQQLSGKAAAAIHRRFLQLYAGDLSASDILATPDDLLRTAGISRPKIAYLKDLAAKLPDFPTLEELADWDDEAIITTLTQVKGIGRWTVQMLLIFRLHRWDVLPTEDLGIRTAMRRLYDLPDLPPKQEMLALAAPWRPYRTIASWYLWRSLDPNFQNIESKP